MSPCRPGFAGLGSLWAFLQCVLPSSALPQYLFWSPGLGAWVEGTQDIVWCVFLEPQQSRRESSGEPSSQSLCSTRQAGPARQLCAVRCSGRSVLSPGGHIPGRARDKVPNALHWGTAVFPPPFLLPSWRCPKEAGVRQCGVPRTVFSDTCSFCLFQGSPYTPVRPSCSAVSTTMRSSHLLPALASRETGTAPLRGSITPIPSPITPW